uniref:Uncharacterized protein n=1 Tax=Ciona savignyi TaxID=51511 RepID=H2YRT8_CIOSA
MGLGFVFRKKLREKYNTFMGSQPPSDENANKTESTYVSGDKLSLPGYSPSASPRYPRRKSGCGCSRSVTFEDEMEEESRSTNAYSYDPYAKSSSVYDSQTDGLDAGSCKFDQYDYFRSRCPEDDTNCTTTRKAKLRVITATQSRGCNDDAATPANKTSSQRQ